MSGGDVRAWLDGLAPSEACDQIDESIAMALRERRLDAVPGLLILMCRYDPRRAERTRAAMLSVTEGRIVLGRRPFGEAIRRALDLPETATDGEVIAEAVVLRTTATFAEAEHVRRVAGG
jgi:hypothetical protein